MALLEAHGLEEAAESVAVRLQNGFALQNRRSNHNNNNNTPTLRLEREGVGQPPPFMFDRLTRRHRRHGPVSTYAAPMGHGPSSTSPSKGEGVETMRGY